MAQEYTQLLGVAGDGRCDRVDLPQGLVRPAGVIRAEFKQKYNRELEPPKTWDELLQVAKFFTGKEIDGKKVYGTYIYTERGSEGITMGVTNALYNYGFLYDNPKKPYEMEGFVNSPGAVQDSMSTRSFTSAASRPA